MLLIFLVFIYFCINPPVYWLSSPSLSSLSSCTHRQEKGTKRDWRVIRVSDGWRVQSESTHAPSCLPLLSIYDSCTARYSAADAVWGDLTKMTLRWNFRFAFCLNTGTNWTVGGAILEEDGWLLTLFPRSSNTDTLYASTVSINCFKTREIFDRNFPHHNGN